MCLFTDNHEKFADLVDTERPEVQAAMTALLTLSKKANELRLMSLYEQRLNRTLLTTMKMLSERQAERKQRQEKEMEEANEIAKLFKMKGETYNPADDAFTHASVASVFRPGNSQSIRAASSTGRRPESPAGSATT
jgi:hypothetical protein